MGWFASFARRAAWREIGKMSGCESVGFGGGWVLNTTDGPISMIALLVTRVLAFHGAPKLPHQFPHPVVMAADPLHLNLMNDRRHL